MVTSVVAVAVIAFKFMTLGRGRIVPTPLAVSIARISERTAANDAERLITVAAREGRSTLARLCAVALWPREAGIEGTVAVRVLVNEQGKVIAADILSSDVTPAMEKAALEAAKQCRFRPAKQRTVPVKAHVMIPFSFQLN